MKIERFEYLDSIEDSMQMRDKLLTIEIKPGLPTGSEFLFLLEGDQGPNIIPGKNIKIK